MADGEIWDERDPEFDTIPLSVRDGADEAECDDDPDALGALDNELDAVVEACADDVALSAREYDCEIETVPESVTLIVPVIDKVPLGENDMQAEADWKLVADAETDEVDDSDA